MKGPATGSRRAGSPAVGEVDLAEPPPEQLAPDLAPVLAPLIDPAVAGLAARLGDAGLSRAERQAVCSGTAAALRQEVWRRVSRVLVLELNAARVTGQLTAASSQERWQEWVHLASRPGYWGSLTERYPTLSARLDRVIANRCAAAARMAERFADDRDMVTTLSGSPAELIGVVPGEGDSHQSGQTVMTLRLPAGRVLYKPRPLDADPELNALLHHLLQDQPTHARIRTPQVACRPGYGWSEHVSHRYCADEAELRSFYRGLGHWLALTQLLGASDLHADNLVAAGPVPVVVDCEALFTPHTPPPPAGAGMATDRALELVASSSLRTGLLPVRGRWLAMHGTDLSAAGQLPGQQPVRQVPTMVGMGTDQAKLGYAAVPVPTALNLPSPIPDPERHWDAVLDGFDELTTRLRDLDRSDRLEPLLAPFRGCRIRVVTRDTVVYLTLARMLWHPVSLHQEPRARRRAVDLLLRHGRTAPLASFDPVVVDAEVTDLLAGDVPLFTALAGHGQFSGPGGVTVGAPRDLVDAALKRWRSLDDSVDRLVIQGAVMSAYLNDRPAEVVVSDQESSRPLTASGRGLDRPLEEVRRAVAADLMRRLAAAALVAQDGTATWIAPVLDSTGWQVRPLPTDLYSGVAGLAVVQAAYRAEAMAGRADPLPEGDLLLDQVLLTLRASHDQSSQQQRAAALPPPEPSGGYAGPGSGILGWLLLSRLGAVDPDEALARSQDLAVQLPSAVAAGQACDLLSGMAGTLVPLLRLAELTRQDRWLTEAGRIGDALAARARYTSHGAHWPGGQAVQGLGGFAHGATGIGWALDRLAAVTGVEGHHKIAHAAFDYEQSLFRPELGGWRDLRKPRGASPWWCHGATGIGIAAADLWHQHSDPRWRQMLGHAATLCWRDGFGTTHTLCHGDLGSWEVLTRALATDAGPDHVDQTAVDSRVLSSLTEHGPRCNTTIDIFVPGLLHGLSGVIYQLLRMHPESPLPSVLLPDPLA